MIAETPLLDRLDLQYWDGASWVSILATATSVKATRGGNTDGVGMKTDVGLLSAVFYNDHDPLIGTPLRIGKQIRIVARPTAEEIAFAISEGRTAEPFAIFTGFVLDVSSSYPLDKAKNESRTFVTVSAVDAVSLHTQTPVRFVDGRGNLAPTGSERIWLPQTTWEERLAKLEEYSRTPVVIPETKTWRTIYAF